MTTRQELAVGWKVLLACMVGVGFGATGLGFYTLGVFLKPLTAEFGWSRAAVSTANLCLQGGLVIGAPIVGRLIDRHGVRPVALVSLAGLAVAFAGLTLLNASVWSLFLGWLALAFLAAGTTPTVWTRTVNAWFHSARGLALGLTLMGTGLAAVLGPMLVGQVVATYGWRAGYLALAAATAAIALPLVFLFLREPPVRAEAAHPSNSGVTLGEAMRTRPFWQCAAGFLLVAGAIAAVLVHLVALLADSGMPQATAARYASLLGLAIIVGRIVVGALVDRLHAPYVGLAFLLLPAAGCVMLANGMAAPAIITFGLAAGAEVDLLAYLAARYFGLKSYGQIYGWLLAIFSLSAGIGPILMGASQDALGSYGPGLYVCAATMVAGAALIGTLGRFPATSR